MGLLDELRDADQTEIQEVVLPWDVKEGAFNREVNRTDGERMTKRCHNYYLWLTGERTKPNPVPSLY